MIHPLLAVIVVPLIAVLISAAGMLALMAFIKVWTTVERYFEGEPEECLDFEVWCAREREEKQ